MVFVIFSFIFMVVGFIFGFVPIIGPILLSFGLESYLWEARKKDPGGLLTMDGRFFFVMTALGMLTSAFIFFEPAPGMALYEPVPGTMFTNVIVFVFACAIFRSNRG